MRFAFRWVGACSAVALITAIGCQRLPEDDNGSGPADSVSAGNVDDDGGGGTFLDTAGARDTDDESDADSNGEPACDIIAQSGCEAGEKCTATKPGANVEYTCVVDTVQHDPLDACTPSLSSGIDGCPAAHACLGDEGQGLCVGLCLTESDCGGGLCVLDPFDDVPHCADACSPFEPSCAMGLACRRREDRYGCLFAEASDVGVAGDTCVLEDDKGCAAGFACLAGALLADCEEDRCCTPLCDLDGGDTCSSPTTCSPALDAPGPGAENVGACFVPS